MRDAGAAPRLGPNAITRVAEALGARHGASATRDVFGHARLARYVDAPPVAMVPEQEVAALHLALRDQLGIPEARAIGREAGRLTAAYLLAYRVPRPMRLLLPHLPASLAAALLLRAIAAHAWTFAGSGRLRVRNGRRSASFALAHSPICAGQEAGEPLCDYQAATIEGLFVALVHSGARTEETRCAAQGEAGCVFVTRW
jgi:divinyl protochlorophyllide a 8-vinyl-reductase